MEKPHTKNLLNRINVAKSTLDAISETKKIIRESSILSKMLSERDVPTDTETCPIQVGNNPKQASEWLPEIRISEAWGLPSSNEKADDRRAIEQYFGNLT